ncbi:ABC-type transport auxiliary lipoprotein family protein [Roseomonas marmotae]|uniref:Membrane integrity-associated transporter subunit PqiC n=1 Tax=Roseomonas marmotae TaxID=2768161 RepID=A0ABS3K6T2_9PROT|nr:ABC-type transport auxiliary lipoprotein family protein [Roseomonas marmotae]MBO1073169.1 membrane integrity-associated transporter subunit PqiC [Roseomonas marmotae]QTI79197.1 membrane integrity-associated transporter subunit PqiC [Roseomonas marmotae]
MMKRRALLLALPMTVALAACGSVLERPYVEVQRFPLDARRPGARRGPGRRVLLLRLMRAGPGMETRGLRSVRPDGTENVDFYAEWVAPPAELAEEALRRWLSASGLFSAVVAPGSRARADYILECELTTLVADIPKRQARAGLSAVLIRDRDGDTQVLRQFAVTGTAPLPAPSADGTLPAEVQAAGMNEALAAALGSLENRIAQFAG